MSFVRGTQGCTKICSKEEEDRFRELTWRTFKPHKCRLLHADLPRWMLITNILQNSKWQQRLFNLIKCVGKKTIHKKYYKSILLHSYFVPVEINTSELKHDSYNMRSMWKELSGSGGADAWRGYTLLTFEKANQFICVVAKAAEIGLIWQWPESFSLLHTVYACTHDGSKLPTDPITQPASQQHMHKHTEVKTCLGMREMFWLLREIRQDEQAETC